MTAFAPAGVFDPAGPTAHGLAQLSAGLLLGGIAVFGAGLLLVAWALRRRRALAWRRWLVGGVAGGALGLAALFAWSVQVGRGPDARDALVIGVRAHQWWWALRYTDPATGTEVRDANELRIPVGRPVRLALDSADVIHSFWVPQLGGKVDMLPGRMTHLLLQADRPGRYVGDCAEFCGVQHARMRIAVVAMPAAQFDDWLAAQVRGAASAARAAPALSAQQLRGREAYLARRCDACHQVRGVGQASRRGPDLSTLGARATLGAGALPNTQASRVQWLADPHAHKAGVHMPGYAALEPDTLVALADWLGTLQ